MTDSYIVNIYIYRNGSSGTKIFFDKSRTQNLLQPSRTPVVVSNPEEQVWHHYPDFSLLLIFYRESKFEVRFLMGPLVVSNPENIVLGSRINKNIFGTRRPIPIYICILYRNGSSGTKNIFHKSRTQNLLEPSTAFQNSSRSLEPRTTSVAPLS